LSKSDCGIEVESRRHELRTELVIDLSCHLVLNLVPDADQKHEVLFHCLAERAIFVLQALLQAPVPGGTISSSEEATAFTFCRGINLPVLDTGLPVIGVK
jgi:hypothetical protein